MDFDQFQNKWLNPPGRQVNPDGVLGYQCVDLILQYASECYGITGERGNAIDYWTSPSSILLTKFERVETQDTLKGDIVVLRTLGFSDYTEPGHITLATGALSNTQYLALEQNGATGNGSGIGGDAIRTRWIDTSRIAGILRPLPVTKPLPYTVGDIVSKDIILPNGGTLWDFTGDSFVNQGSYPADYRETVAAIANYKDGTQFYLVSNMSTTGFNVKEAVDYVAPPPKSTLTNVESTPITIPTSKVPYTVIKTIPAYTSATAAGNHTAGGGVVLAGEYYIYNTYPDKDNLVNVSKVLGKPGSWINTDDNQEEIPVSPVVSPPSTWESPRATSPPPVNPSAWKRIFYFNLPSQKPVTYLSQNKDNLLVYNLEDSSMKTHIVMKPFTELYLIGKFYKDGNWYGVDKRFANNKTPYYGFNMAILDKYDEIFDTAKTLAEKVVTKSTKASDYPALFYANLKKSINGIFRIKPKQGTKK